MGSVVITGASSGFGRAAAKCFSDAGFDLVLVARRADRLAEMKTALSSAVEVVTIALDVRQSHVFPCMRPTHRDRYDVVDARAVWPLPFLQFDMLAA